MNRHPTPTLLTSSSSDTTIATCAHAALTITTTSPPPQERCQPPDDAVVAPGLRALALIRGRVIDGCAQRLREMVALEVQACSIASPQFTALALYASPVRLPPPRPHHQVQRKPRALHRDEVRALVVQATHGLFPEHNHVLDVGTRAAGAR